MLGRGFGPGADELHRTDLLDAVALPAAPPPGTAQPRGGSCLLPAYRAAAACRRWPPSARLTPPGSGRNRSRAGPRYRPPQACASTGTAPAAAPSPGQFDLSGAAAVHIQAMTSLRFNSRRAASSSRAFRRSKITGSRRRVSIASRSSVGTGVDRLRRLGFCRHLPDHLGMA